MQTMMIMEFLYFQVYGVQAGSCDVNSHAFYKELADRTNGAYVKFSNFSLIQDMFLAGKLNCSVS